MFWQRIRRIATLTGPGLVARRAVSVGAWVRQSSSGLGVDASALAACGTLADVKTGVATFAASQPSHGHVAFINSALAHMKARQIQPDVQVYTMLLSVFPKGRHQTTGLLDALWPRDTPQSECALAILEEMEESGIIPVAATFGTLLEVFGRASAPVLKCRRMTFWMRRFMANNPFAAPSDLATLPRGSVAKLVLQRIAGRAADITCVRDAPYLLSSQTDGQASKMRALSAAATSDPVVIDGPCFVWFGGKREAYYIMSHTSTGPLAMCVSETNDRESLQLWSVAVTANAPSLPPVLLAIQQQ